MKNVEIMARPARKPINCLYQCAFTTTYSHLIENHYRQEHYLKSKEVKHA